MDTEIEAHTTYTVLGQTFATYEEARLYVLKNDIRTIVDAYLEIAYLDKEHQLPIIDFVEAMLENEILMRNLVLYYNARVNTWERDRLEIKLETDLPPEEEAAARVLAEYHPDALGEGQK